MRIYAYFFALFTWHADQGPHSRTKGLGAQSPFSRITRKISPFGTWHFKIIATNKKAIFRENFSSYALMQVRYSRLQLFVADQGPHTVVPSVCLALAGIFYRVVFGATPAECTGEEENPVITTPSDNVETRDSSGRFSSSTKLLKTKERKRHATDLL